MRATGLNLESEYAERETLLREIREIRERRRRELQFDVEDINRDYDRQVTHVRKAGRMSAATLAWVAAAFFAWTAALACL